MTTINKGANIGGNILGGIRALLQKGLAFFPYHKRPWTTTIDMLLEFRGNIFELHTHSLACLRSGALSTRVLSDSRRAAASGGDGGNIAEQQSSNS